MRKDIIVIVNHAKYLAFVLATICVLVFQFTANSLCINLALSLYVVAFGLLCASSIIHSKEVFQAYKMIEKQNAQYKSIETSEDRTMDSEKIKTAKDEEGEHVNLKSELAWSIVGSIFFGLFAIFTFVVLVLY